MSSDITPAIVAPFRWKETMTSGPTRLALHGGQPTFAAPPGVWPPEDAEIEAALQQAWKNGDWGRYDAPLVERLAQSLADVHQVAYALPCCSGTFAVELALRAVPVRDGEVILAGYDFPGNFRAIEAVGARPVLVDITPRVWSLDPGALADAVSEATRAIIVSHLHGGIADMPAIVDFARERGLAVIEDACQATGGSLQGRPLGSWGDLGILSFGGSKLLTSGRGGALLTSSAEMYQRAKIFCERGNQAFPLSQLQAAVLLPQLNRLEQRTGTRWSNVQRLWQRCNRCTRLQALALRPHAIPAFYKLGWLLAASDLENGPDDERSHWAAAARAEGLPIDTGFRGFSNRSARRCTQIGSLPHSRDAARNTLILHHPVLLESDAVIDRVADGLTKIYRGLSDD